MVAEKKNENQRLNSWTKSANRARDQTEKPQFLSAKAEKLNQKLDKFAKPTIPTPTPINQAWDLMENLRSLGSIYE